MNEPMIILPTYTFRIRLSQIIIAILVLILNIVSLAILGGYGALSYGVFTPIATCIIVAYWYYGNYRRTDLYNRWAILILDCFAVIWWLSMWCLLAEWAAAIGIIDSIDNTYDVGLTSLNVVYALTAVSAVLGAVEFVLFVVSLLSFSIRLHRARVNEQQNIHQNPFTNANYQIHNASSTGPEVFRPKGGFEVA